MDVQPTIRPETELGQGGRGVIVVGIDGSEESRNALRWAAGIAGRTGALLDVVMAWHAPVSIGWEVPSLIGIDFEADAHKVVTAVVDEVFGSERPQGLRTFVPEGGAAPRLIEHAAEALMLVVGNRGRGGFTGLLLGSVSSACAAHATCPVLIVHADDPPPR